MNHRLYLMDTLFGLGTRAVTPYPPAAQCAIAAELGLGQVYLSCLPGTGPSAVTAMRDAAAAHDLALGAVYVTVPAYGPGRAEGLEAARDVADALPDGCDLELAWPKGEGACPQTPEALEQSLITMTRQLADRLAPGGGRVVLYPHAGFQIETTGDAVRLCRAVDTAHVRAILCGFHWYVADATPLATVLAEAAPYLVAANLSGVRRPGEVAGHAILPVDEGILDNFAVIAALRRIGFTGRIGVQGYGLGGDAYRHGQRSVAAIREMWERAGRLSPWPDEAPAAPASG